MRWIAVVLLVSLGSAAHAELPPLGPTRHAAVERLREKLPRSAAACAEVDPATPREEIPRIDNAGAELVWRSHPSFESRLNGLRELLRLQAEVDREVDALVELRRNLSELADPQRRRAARNWLQVAAATIELSGRLRYSIRDGAFKANAACEGRAERELKLVAALREGGAGMGSVAVSGWLARRPLEPRVANELLRLAIEAPTTEMVGPVADFVRRTDVPAWLTILGADALLRLGLPQSLPPGKRLAEDDFRPQITPAEALARLEKIDRGRLPEAWAQRLDKLLAIFQTRSASGIPQGEGYLLAGQLVRPGDWFLMRNPSPYNEFTDLSPGLFTHVGVVTAEVGTDGVRRIVIADMPERGARIPSENVELYVRNSLHYFFLRDADAKVAARMAAAAAAMIGNESQFDLTFDLAGIEPLADQPLRGKRINTYCAGFLMLCAQKSGRPVDEFFPIRERPSSPRTRGNLKTLGLSLGKGFISPSGPLFSSRMRLVAARAPLYEPTREIKEAVYDHFARLMYEREIQPSPDLKQSLRARLAEAAESNAWLKQALADANNVSRHMDLASAAKAAAVIETLDQIANNAAEDFKDVRLALTLGPEEGLAAKGATAADIDQIRRWRQEHAALFAAWTRREISPRELRTRLVAYYTRAGQQRLEKRFFPD